MASAPSSGGKDKCPMKTLARESETCNGCRKSRLDFQEELNIVSVSFKECGACRTAFYCSAACQLAHWRKEHKQVCKALAADRAYAVECAPGFLKEFEQWERSSKLYLDHMTVMMLHDAAVSASRPGARVTIEALARENCAVLDGDYRSGIRLPFRMRDNYRLMAFEALESSKLATSTRGVVRPSIQEEVKQTREAVLREEVASGDVIVLIMLIQVGPMTRLRPTIVTREYFTALIDQSKAAGVTASIMLRDIKEGLGGTGTTKSSRRIGRKSGSQS